MLGYLRPTTIEETVSILNQYHDKAVLHAGGTDLIPRWSRGLLERPEYLIDLKGVDAITGVSREDGRVRIGACTVLGDIAYDPIIRSLAPVLADAAGRVACPQVRNRATIGGNLCNASPAADMAIPLILLDAILDLVGPMGQGTVTRRVPITDFFRGPGSTVLGPGEVLTAISFRPSDGQVFAAWDKFGTRPAMEIAVASVGVALWFESGVVGRARIGYGSVAPVPLRGPQAEALLTGKRLSDDAIVECVKTARSEIAPISDVRGSEDYRREVVGVMLGRMLDRAASGETG